MSSSVFDLFKIGIGPSSSHTVGPMIAAREFLLDTQKSGIFDQIHHLKVELFGSLALTGEGHGTPGATLLGLLGYAPDTIDPNQVESLLAQIQTTHKLGLLSQRVIDFDATKELCLCKEEFLDFHPNGMRFTAMDQNYSILTEGTFYSVGGGFIVNDADTHKNEDIEIETILPYRFDSAASLTQLCKDNNLTIAELILENEKIWRSPKDIEIGLSKIWQTMKNCVERGTHTEGILPGTLKVRRRASKIYKDLGDHPTTITEIMDWVNLFALAVNEENAAGGRVVTAPTNGAAGVIPAVMHYYDRFVNPLAPSQLTTFLLTASAIGYLFQIGASISAAEMGCQGEIGVACSMAAGALTAVLGGSTDQITNAAEIGMEHNLGLTCDPIGGLVQIPCIERNTMGAIKAINASNLALRGDGFHHVSLDEVIATMRKTGEDMRSEYKETSLGGLAVNVIEC